MPRFGLARTALLGLLAAVSLLSGGFAVVSGFWPSTAPASKAVAAVSVTARSFPAVRPDPHMTLVSRPRTSASAFQAGATVLIYGNDPGFVAKSTALLDRLATLGVNSVGLAFPVFQDNWTSSVVRVDPNVTPSLDNMALFIREAHQRGFTVMLRPLLDENSLHPDGKWRGVISPTDPGQWFTTYGAVLGKYAGVASANRVEIFDIGTELVSMQPDTGQWLGLIAQLRSVYSGQLTYSANWSDPITGFGSALDFVGIDAFFPLDAPAGATVAQLAQAWRPWLSEIQQAGQSAGRPVVASELGTTSETSSYQQPWVWKHGTGTNLADQANYYAASCQALKAQVSGMYWWHFSLDPNTPDPYIPENKLAEQQIANCFH